MRFKEILVAGSGGQGVLTLGLLLARAAFREGLQVSWLPAYGPEQRGGAAYSMVVVSEGEVLSPIVEEPDLAVFLHPSAFGRFQPLILPRTLVLYDSSLFPSSPLPGAWGLPALQLASELGDGRVQNMVLLGAALGRTGFLPPQRVEETMEEEMGWEGKTLDLNRRAFRRGWDFAGER
jgi:Pyruvate/2-oxoacid:ferredoxin oxidoreductase gamma subunit